jgi:hypothetical protein
MARKQGRLLDAFLTIPGWLDWISRAWPLLLALGGAGAMGALASMTSWVNQWGPFAWGLVSLAAFLVLYGAFLLGVSISAKAAVARANAKFATSIIDTANINPLEVMFEKKRIQMRDFYHPFFRSHERTRFRNCEIYGPATVALQGSPTFDRSNFTDCDFVVVEEGGYSATIMVFDSPTFEHCEFYRVTFMVTPLDAKRLMDGLGPTMNIIAGRAALNAVMAEPNS